MSRASKLASARGETHHARHATNVAREKLNRITAERDKLRKQISAQAEALSLARLALETCIVIGPDDQLFNIPQVHGALAAIDTVGV